jgi:hypothetical protein
MIPIAAYLPKVLTVRGSWNILPPVFYIMQLSSWIWQNFTELDNNTAEGTVTFQCGLHLCQQSSSTFEQEHVFPPCTSCSPSAATGAWHPTVPHHWCKGTLTGFLSKEQTGDKLMVWVQNCKEDAGGNIMVAGFLNVERVLVNIMSKVTTVNSSHWNTKISIRKISGVSVAPPWH